MLYTAGMKTLTVGDLKTNFSKVVSSLKQGKTFLVSYGRNKEKIGVILPYSQYAGAKRKLGALEKKGSYTLASDFQMTDGELLQS